MSDLYERLESLSKSLEGSGRLDEHENPDAYATVLEAMNLVRADLPALLRMLANRARHFPTFPIGGHIPEVFAALGESPPEGGGTNDGLKPADIVERLRSHWGSSLTIEAADEIERLRAALAAPTQEQARAELLAELAQALCDDCENGVKWLNEKAADKFKADYPHLSAAMKGTA